MVVGIHSVGVCAAVPGAGGAVRVGIASVFYPAH